MPKGPFTVRTVLRGIRDAYHGVWCFGFEQLAQTNPLIRIYLDSDLDSPAEDSILRVASSAVSILIVKAFPALKEDPEKVSELASVLTKAVLSRLDRFKLMWKFQHGQITAEKYYAELIKRDAALMAVTAKKGLSLTISHALTSLGVPEEAAHLLAQLIEEKVSPLVSEENCEALLVKGYAYLDAAINFVDKKVEAAREYIKKKVEKIKERKKRREERQKRRQT